jgi:hypothetical protein
VPGRRASIRGSTPSGFDPRAIRTTRLLGYNLDYFRIRMDEEEEFLEATD